MDSEKFQVWPKRLFLTMAFISCFTCYARADYNLPLFAFAYLLWDIDITQKIRLIYLFVFSFIVDLVWLIIWGIMKYLYLYLQDLFGTQASSKIIGRKEFRALFYISVFQTSLLNFQLGAIIICIVAERECKNALHPDGILNHLKNVLNVTPPQQGH